MAILVAIRSTKQSPSAMHGLINYCLQEKKTFDINSDRNLITGVNCIPQNAYTKFMTTKAVYHQERGVNFYHFSQSFSPEEKITPEEAHEVAIEFVKKAWPGHEVLVCTHMDEPHLHSNIIVNSVNFENGTKLHLSPSLLKVLRDMNDEVCKSHGLSVLPPYEKGRKGMSTREFRAAEKGQSWKFRLMSDIRESMKRSGTREEFTKEMARRGYEMKWTDERKYITFTCPNGMKCRDNKLHHDKFLKEELENEFKIREQLTRKINFRGIDGQEFREVGGISQHTNGSQGVYVAGKQRSIEIALLSEVVNFQPKIYRKVCELATKEQIERMSQTMVQNLLNENRSIMSNLISTNATTVAKMENLLQQDGKMRDEYISEFSKTLDKEANKLSQMTDMLKQHLLKFLAITVGAATLFSTLVSVLLQL